MKEDDESKHKKDEKSLSLFVILFLMLVFILSYWQNVTQKLLAIIRKKNLLKRE